MQIITTHQNTDFDALASLFAAAILYPESVVVMPTTVNPNVKAFLTIHKNVFNSVNVNDIDLSEVRRLIVVDVNSWRRLDQMKKLKSRDDLEVLLWDHHKDDGDIEADWKCHEEIGATITLIVRRLRKEKKVLTPIQATLFLAGLYEDTGNLSFSSSKAEDAYAAAYLLECKADLNIVNSVLRPAYGEKQRDILFAMLQSAQRKIIKGFKVSLNRVDLAGHVQGLSIVVNMYRDIVNVDAAIGIFLVKERNKCMIIGRSLPDTIDVGAVMRNLGGGGHPGAGSAMLQDINADEVEALLSDEIASSQKTSVQISDLMSFPVLTVTPETNMKEVAMILRQEGCTGIPVVKKDKLVGIISRHDFRKVRKDSQLAAPVKAFMRTDILTITPGKQPIQAARIMAKHGVGRLPVVDDTGRVIGIVTRTDAMRYFYDLPAD